MTSVPIMCVFRLARMTNPSGLSLTTEPILVCLFFCLFILFLFKFEFDNCAHFCLIIFQFVIYLFNFVIFLKFEFDN